MLKQIYEIYIKEKENLMPTCQMKGHLQDKEGDHFFFHHG